MLQIPTVQTCSTVKISGKAKVPLWNGEHEGEFLIDLDLSFSRRRTATGYPSGVVKLAWSRPGYLRGSMQSTVIENLSLGVMKGGPTLFVEGMCQLTSRKPAHFWIMIANEGFFSVHVKDVISFVILDVEGEIVAHGAGMAKSGSFRFA